MKGLKSITFYNTGRFAYGHIDVDENSLLTGTNGVGKTTTSQAMLFFYGTTRSDQLGITRREGKTSWSKYMYPHSNSYIFYRYTGLHGDILLMTYQHGNGVAWRFMLVEGNIDLNAIVLENQVVKNPKEVLKDFLIAGYKPSSQITDPGVYRKILYGSIDTRKEKDLGIFR
jgi:energy-coupling factor transporter ATP-binding protein EcfA2